LMPRRSTLQGRRDIPTLRRCSEILERWRR
jgi:hypothetical protein